MTSGGLQGLAIESDRQGDVLHLHVRGELDMSTTPQLTAAVDAAADEPVKTVVLDLRGVTFIDSSGLRVLVLSGRNLAASDRVLQVGPRSEMVTRVLDMTNLSQGSDAFEVLPEDD